MVAVFVLDKRLRCDFINAVAEYLTGTSLAEARGRPLADLLWPSNPDAFASSPLGRILEARAAGEGEEILADRSGASRPFMFRIEPLSGAEGGSVVELIDLSGETGTGRALRVSEQRLRLAVEATGVGIWDVNAVTGERQWSDEFRQILGLPLDTEASEETFVELIHPADRDYAAKQYRNAYGPSSPGSYHAEFRICRANDNATRWVSTTGRIAFDGSGRAVRGIGIMLDITDRREAEEQQRLIMRELTHRVKNNIAVVQAIVSQTIRTSRRPAEAFEKIQARLMAISHTHDFLNRSNPGAVLLSDLIRGELDPYATHGTGRIALQGPSITLDSSAALALGLVIHEMATNAAKYGSLSTDEGRLEVSWSVESGDSGSDIVLSWIESGGPRIRPPRRSGFGTRLIAGSVSGNLGGQVDLNYPPTGLEATLTFRLHAPKEGGNSVPQQVPAEESAPTAPQR